MGNEKEFEEGLTDYLKKNGIEEIPTSNKEKLELLKKIVFHSRVDIDFTDLKHSKEVAKGIKDDNYINNIHNLEINVYHGLYYISNVKGIIREEKKLERRAKIKKIFKLK